MPTTRPAQTTSDFSVELAQHLRTYIKEREHAGVTVLLVAARLGRSVNYVYDRLSGLRPLDTDILTAVAALSHIDPRTLLLTLAARMVTPTT